MFQLPEPTNVMLQQITTHLVKRGKKEFRDAYSLHFELEAANAAVLALLHPKLCAALYHDAKADDGQQTAPGIDPVLPDLRFPRMAQFPWPDEATGMDLVVVLGLGDERSNVALDDGKLSTKTVNVKQGGTARLAFSFWTEAMPDGALDKLRGKQRQSVQITLVQPERLRADAVIDGTVGHPGAAAAQRAAEEAGQQRLDADATGAFLAQHGDPEDEDRDDGEGSAPDAEPAPAKRRGRAKAAA